MAYKGKNYITDEDFLEVHKADKQAYDTAVSKGDYNPKQSYGDGTYVDRIKAQQDAMNKYKTATQKAQSKALADSYNKVAADNKEYQKQELQAQADAWTDFKEEWDRVGKENAQISWANRMLKNGTKDTKEGKGAVKSAEDAQSAMDKDSKIVQHKKILLENSEARLAAITKEIQDAGKNATKEMYAEYLNASEAYKKDRSVFADTYQQYANDYKDILIAVNRDVAQTERLQQYPGAMPTPAPEDEDRMRNSRKYDPEYLAQVFQNTKSRAGVEVTESFTRGNVLKIANDTFTGKDAIGKTLTSMDSQIASADESGRTHLAQRLTQVRGKVQAEYDKIPYKGDSKAGTLRDVQGILLEEMRIAQEEIRNARANGDAEDVAEAQRVYDVYKEEYNRIGEVLDKGLDTIYKITETEEGYDKEAYTAAYAKMNSDDPAERFEGMNEMVDIIVQNKSSVDQDMTITYFDQWVKENANEDLEKQIDDMLDYVIKADREFTRTGYALGTMAYDPEKAKKEFSADTKLDVLVRMKATCHYYSSLSSQYMNLRGQEFTDFHDEFSADYAKYEESEKQFHHFNDELVFAAKRGATQEELDDIQAQADTAKAYMDWFDGKYKNWSKYDAVQLDRLSETYQLEKDIRKNDNFKSESEKKVDSNWKPKLHEKIESRLYQFGFLDSHSKSDNLTSGIAYSEYMTEDEQKTLAYLVNTGRTEDAQNYFTAKEPEWEMRHINAMTEHSEEHWFTGLMVDAVYQASSGIGLLVPVNAAVALESVMDQYQYGYTRGYGNTTLGNGISATREGVTMGMTNVFMPDSTIACAKETQAALDKHTGNVDAIAQKYGYADYEAFINAMNSQEARAQFAAGTIVSLVENAARELPTTINIMSMTSQLSKLGYSSAVIKEAVETETKMSLAIMGGSVAAETLQQKLNEGQSLGQALTYAALCGTMEYVTERIGVDALVDGVSGRVGDAIKSFASGEVKNASRWVLTRNAVIGAAGLAKQGMAEGIEELISGVSDRIFDVWINGENSEFSTVYREALLEGMSPVEAKAYAKKQMVEGVAEDFLGGFASGLAFGGWSTVKNHVNSTSVGMQMNKDTVAGAKFINNMVNLTNVDSETHKIASALKQKMDTAGKYNITDYEMGTLISAYNTELADMKAYGLTQEMVEYSRMQGSDITPAMYIYGTQANFNHTEAYNANAVLTSILQGEELTSAQIKILQADKNANARKILSNMLGYDLEYGSEQEVRAAIQVYENNVKDFNILKEANATVREAAENASVEESAERNSEKAQSVADNTVEGVAQEARNEMEAEREEENITDAKVNRDMQQVVSMATTNSAEVQGDVTAVTTTEERDNAATVAMRQNRFVDTYTKIASNASRGEEYAKSKYREVVNQAKTDGKAKLVGMNSDTAIVVQENGAVTEIHAKDIVDNLMTEYNLADDARGEVERMIREVFDKAAESEEALDFDKLSMDTEGIAKAIKDGDLVIYSDSNPNNDAQKIVDVANKALKGLGAVSKIELDYSMTRDDANGRYDKKTKTLYINPYLGYAYRDNTYMTMQENLTWVIGHEFGHYLVAEAGGIKVLEDLIKIQIDLGNVSEDSIKGRIDPRIQSYAKHDIKLSRTDALEEIYCDTLGNLFGRYDLFDRLTQEQAERCKIDKLLDRVISIRDKAAKMFGKSKDQDSLKVVNDTTSLIELSIRKLTGNEFSEVELESLRKEFALRESATQGEALNEIYREQLDAFNDRINSLEKTLENLDAEIAKKEAEVKDGAAAITESILETLKTSKTECETALTIANVQRELMQQDFVKIQDQIEDIGKSSEGLSDRLLDVLENGTNDEIAEAIIEDINNDGSASAEAFGDTDETKWSREEDSILMDKAVAKNRQTKMVSTQVLNTARSNREKIKAELDKVAQYLPADIKGNPVVTNASYGKSVENALVCVRSLVANWFADEVSVKVGRPLTVDEQMMVSQVLANVTGEQTECTYCYVATDRKTYRAMFNNYFDQYEDVFKKVQENYDAYQADEDALGEFSAYKKVKSAYKITNPDITVYGYKEFLNGRADTANMRLRYAAFVREGLSGTMSISRGDLATSKTRQDAMSSKAKKWLIQDSESYSKSAAWPKKMHHTVKINGKQMLLDYVAYGGSILGWKQSVVDKLNSDFGLRMYSDSDYVPAFLLENMQEVTDAAVRGLKMLSYTKDVGFAETFAPTGMGINISIFGEWVGYSDKGEGLGFKTGEHVNPEPVMNDEMMGASWKKAQEVRAKYPNVGIVFVATNDKLVEWAMRQDWIDVVIPYHTVRTGAEVAAHYGYKNYKGVQEDKKLAGWTKGVHKKSISPVDHLNDKETYLRLLKENHLSPRFEQWIDKPGYMKLVNETRMPYATYTKEDGTVVDGLEPVQPIFDMDSAMREVARIEREGSYGLLQGIDTMEDQREVLDDFVDMAAENVKKDSKYSYDDETYLKAVEDGDMETAQRMVDEAARDAGYTRLRYHETKPDNDIHIFNLELNTNASADEQTPFGIFTKETDRGIGLGGKQMRLYVKAENTFNVENREEIQSKLPKEYSEIIDKLSAINSERESNLESLEDAMFDALDAWQETEEGDRLLANLDASIPAYKQFGDAVPEDVRNAEIAYEQYMEQWHDEESAIIGEAKQWITDWLKDNGYDSMYLAYDNGVGGRSTDALIVLNENQVKSADPVTYDDKDKVIPLSDRFDSESNDIRYSIDETVQSRIYDAYQKEVDNILTDATQRNDPVLMGYTPQLLQDIGIPQLPMVVGPGHIYSMAKTEQEAITEGRYRSRMHYHGLGAETVKTLWEKISDPYMIISSKDLSSSFPVRSMQSVVVLINISNVQSEQLLVPIEITARRTFDGNVMDVNVLSSAYIRKTDALITEAIAQENTGGIGIFYISNDAMTKVASSVQFATLPTKIMASGVMVHDVSEKVNLKIQNQTQTLQFMRWFGDWQNDPDSASKIVNEDGTPMVMYHGSPAGGFDTFNPGLTFFTNSYDVAKTYTTDTSNNQLYACYLSIKNPLTINAELEWDVDWTNIPFRGSRKSVYEIAKTAQAEGHDGVRIIGLEDVGGRSEYGYTPGTTPSHIETDIVFDSEQIKSATDNVGTFDAKNPSIKYSYDDTLDKQGVTGNSGTIHPVNTGDRVKVNIPFHYAIVPYSALIMSHDASGNVNPDYDQTLQPRNRATKAYRDEAIERAQMLEPDVMMESKDGTTGAPFVRPDGTVISGNGRMISLGIAYTDDLYKKSGVRYRDYLLQNAGRFGIDSADIMHMENPVLVRVGEGDLNWKELASQMNESAVSNMVSGEVAKQDAGALDISILSKLHITANMNYASVNNVSFVMDFLHAIPGGAADKTLFNENGLTQQGEDRIRNAIVYYAYGNSDIVSEISSDTTQSSVTKTLVRYAPTVAMYKARVENGDFYNSTAVSDLIGALNLFEKSQKGSTKGQSVTDIASYSPAMGNEDYFSTEQVQIAQAIQNLGAEDRARFISTLLDSLEYLDINQINMMITTDFGELSESGRTHEIIAIAKETFESDTGKETGIDLNYVQELKPEDFQTKKTKKKSRKSQRIAKELAKVSEAAEAIGDEKLAQLAQTATDIVAGEEIQEEIDTQRKKEIKSNKKRGNKTRTAAEDAAEAKEIHERETMRKSGEEIAVDAMKEAGVGQGTDAEAADIRAAQAVALQRLQSMTAQERLDMVIKSALSKNYPTRTRTSQTARNTFVNMGLISKYLAQRDFQQVVHGNRETFERALARIETDPKGWMTELQNKEEWDETDAATALVAAVGMHEDANHTYGDDTAYMNMLHLAATKISNAGRVLQIVGQFSNTGIGVGMRAMRVMDAVVINANGDSQAIEDFKKELEENGKKLVTTQAEYDEVMRREKELMDKLDALEKELAELQGQKRDAQKENRSLKGKINNRENRIQQTSEDVDNLRNTNANDSAKVGTLEDELAELNRTRDYLKHDNARLETQFRGYERRIQQTINDIKNLRESNRNLHKMVDKKRAELEDLLLKRSNLDAKNRNLMKKGRALIRQINYSKEQIKKANDLVGKLTNSLTDIGGMNPEDLVRQLQVATSDLRIENQRLQSLIKRLNRLYGNVNRGATLYAIGDSITDELTASLSETLAKVKTDKQKEELMHDIVDYARQLDAWDGNDVDDIVNIIRQMAERRGFKPGKMWERVARAQKPQYLKQYAFAELLAIPQDWTADKSFLPFTKNNVFLQRLASGRGLATLQYLAQLMNTRTWMRNVVSNTAFYGINTIAKNNAAAVDTALGLITGQRTVAFTAQWNINKRIASMQAEMEKIQEKRNNGESVSEKEEQRYMSLSAGVDNLKNLIAATDATGDEGRIAGIKNRLGKSFMEVRLDVDTGASLMGKYENPSTDENGIRNGTTMLQQSINKVREKTAGIQSTDISTMGAVPTWDVVNDKDVQESYDFQDNLLKQLRRGDDSVVTYRRQFKMAQEGIWGGVSKFLSMAEMINGYALNCSDEFFKGAIYQGAINSYAMLVAEGTMDIDQAIEYAVEDMLYATFQDETKIGRLLNDLHDAFNLGFNFGLGDVMVKYRTVPGALLTRGIEFSPAGALKGIYSLAKMGVEQVRDGGVSSRTQRNAALAIGRALPGTLLTALAFVLARKGILRNPDDEKDKDVAAQMRSNGISATMIDLQALAGWIASGFADDFEFEPGDDLYDIGFLDPFGSNISMGSYLAQLVGDGYDDFKGLLGAMVTNTPNANLKMMMGSFSDLSMMDTLNDLFSIGQYMDDDATAWDYIVNGMFSVATSAVTGFQPSFIRQIAQSMDNSYRDVYAAGKWTERGEGEFNEGMQKLQYSVMMNIPGLRQKIPEKQDNYGNTKQYAREDQAHIGNVYFANVMNAFFNPGRYTKYSQTEIDKFIQDRIAAGGNPELMLDRNAPNYVMVHDKKVALSAEDKQGYKPALNQVYDPIASDIMDHAGELTDEQVDRYLMKAKSYSQYQMKQALWPESDARTAYIDELKQSDKYKNATATEQKAMLAEADMVNDGFDKIEDLMDNGMSFLEANMLVDKFTEINNDTYSEEFFTIDTETDKHVSIPGAKDFAKMQAIDDLKLDDDSKFNIMERMMSDTSDKIGKIMDEGLGFKDSINLYHDLHTIDNDDSDAYYTINDKGQRVALSGEKNFAKMQVIGNLDISDEQKLSLVNSFVSESQYEHLSNIMNNTGTVTFAEAAEAYGLYNDINNMSKEDFEKLSSANKATYFDNALYNMGFDAAERAAVEEEYAMRMSMRQQLDSSYSKMLRTGMDSDLALKIDETIKELQPLDGNSTVSEKQKYEAVGKMKLKDGDKLSAYRALASTTGADGTNVERSVLNMVDDNTAQNLVKMYEKTGDSTYVSRAVGQEYTINGKKHAYSEDEQKEYSKAYANYLAGIDNVYDISSGSYTSAKGEEISISNKALDFAGSYAMYKAVGSKWSVDDMSTDMKTGYKIATCESKYGMSPATYLKHWTKVQQIKAEYSDGEGAAIKSYLKSVTSSTAEYQYLYRCIVNWNATKF